MTALHDAPTASLDPTGPTGAARAAAAAAAPAPRVEDTAGAASARAPWRSRLLVPSVVAAMVALSGASFVIFPLLPALQNSLGVTTAQVGYLAAAGFAAALVAELIVAPAADRGHARLMAIIGVLMDRRMP